MTDEDFDFSKYWPPFAGIVPDGLAGALMQSLVLVSKTWRTAYEEHINNGFTEEQALTLVLSLQRDVLKTAGYITAEVAKVMAPRPSGGESGG